MTAVDERSGTISAVLIRPYSEVKRGYTFVREGDVLFAKITPCMQNGKHAIARGLTDGVGFASTEFHVVRPGNEVHAAWVHHFLRQPAVLNSAVRSFTGSAGQQRVPPDFLRALELPVPPMSEQLRVLRILSEQLEAMERARAAAEARLEAAALVSAAYLRKVFESAAARGWRRKRIRDIAECCSGATPSRHRPEYFRGAIPWVKTGELRDDLIESTDEHVTEVALRETSLRLLPAGTLLVAMYGQGQTRGRTGLLAGPATTNQACFAVLPNPSEFDPAYLQLWFRYSYLRIRGRSEGRGGNQPNLSGALLGSEEVPLPPLEQQRRVVDVVKTEIGAGELLRNAVGQEIEVISALQGALLRRAFSGEL